MRVATRPFAWAVLGVFSSACGASGGELGDVGVYEPDGGSSFGPADAGPSGLDAYVEEGTVAVTFVTLSCADGCADVRAVGVGGHPPYTFAWEDGSNNAVRHVCPTSNMAYRVTVTDTASTGELARPAQTAQASLTAQGIACPDGGASQSSVCLPNASFEGTPPFTFGAFDAPPWAQCTAGAAYANIWNASQLFGIAPSDGSTYLRLALNASVPAADAGGSLAAVSEALCAPLAAGSARGLELDLANETSDSAGGVLQLFGGGASCTASDLLWTSPAVTASGWQRYCATLAPSIDVTYLSFALLDPAGQSAAVYVDHLVPVSACP